MNAGSRIGKARTFVLRVREQLGRVTVGRDGNLAAPTTTLQDAEVAHKRGISFSYTIGLGHNIPSIATNVKMIVHQAVYITTIRVSTTKEPRCHFWIPKKAHFPSQLGRNRPIFLEPLLEL